MKEREKKRVFTEGKLTVTLVIALVLGLVFCGAFIANKLVVEKQEQALLEETPLKDTVYWHSMDNFPKYKVEAAKMVDELMGEGISQEEACRTALEMVSDKIYEDTIEFIEENPGAEDNWEEEYKAYVAKTQK